MTLGNRFFLPSSSQEMTRPLLISCAWQIQPLHPVSCHVPVCLMMLLSCKHEIKPLEAPILTQQEAFFTPLILCSLIPKIPTRSLVCSLTNSIDTDMIILPFPCSCLSHPDTLHFPCKGSIISHC